MALSISQTNLFAKSPFRESNTFFEKFNIHCLFNESIVTPNKPALQAFGKLGEGEEQKRELTPISFMAINHILSSPDGKYFLGEVKSSTTTQFEAKSEKKDDEFSLQLLKEDSQNSILINKPFSQINLFRTYSDPTTARQKQGERSALKKYSLPMELEPVKEKKKIKLYELLKHDLMMIEKRGGDCCWGEGNEVDEQSSEESSITSGSCQGEEDLVVPSCQGVGVSILNYMDTEQIDENLEQFFTSIAQRISLDETDTNQEDRAAEPSGAQAACEVASAAGGAVPVGEYTPKK